MSWAFGQNDRVQDEVASAVVTPVPDAEPAVARWRERFDPSATQGMPAHITALVPFLLPSSLTEGVLARLREICENVAILDVEFSRTSRFPDVVYLEPEPAGELVALTEAIAASWPRTPPYGGAFPDIVPHLTIAGGASEQEFGEIEADVLSRLPIRTRLTHACLYVSESGRWRVQAKLPFAG